MIATGTFGPISNPEVRLALAAVKSESDVYADYRQQATQQWNDVYFVVWLEKTGIHRIPPLEGLPRQMPGAVSADVVTAGLRDEFFRAVMDRRRIFLFFVAQNGDDLDSAMVQALERIREELAARTS